MNVYPPGSLIAGQYEVAGRPMLGGMGLVYLCFDHQEQRPVALKTFRPELLPDRAARDRFLREGSTWVALGCHPHIVRAYGVVRVGDGREVYLVLELVAREEGRADASLRSWLTPGRPLPVEQALLCGLQVAWGMAHAVAVLPGLVHRDLKPENLLVGADKLPCGVNRLRITDFGLAQVLQEAGGGQTADELEHAGGARHSMRAAGFAGGTPEYAAPEQWGERGLDFRVDIYALGCILTEMLIGQMPVQASPRLECGRLHRAGQALQATQGLAPAIRGVLGCCLAVEPAERYGSWAEVENALEDAYVAVAGRAAAVSPGLEAASNGQLAGDAGREERVAAGWSYSAMGASYLDIGKAAVALEYFRRTREIGEVLGERRLTGAGLNGLALAHRDQARFSLAVEESERALHIAREIGDKPAEKAVLGNLGTCYRHLGRLADALTCHERCLSIARELGDRPGEARALSCLGLHYQEVGQVNRAIECHQQHLEIAHETGDRADEASALVNLGICYFVSGKAVVAVSFHQRALSIAREIGDLRGTGKALAGLGQCHLPSDSKKAREYLEQALSISREVGDRLGEAGALGALAACWCQLGQFKEAEGLAWKSLKITDEIGSSLTSAGTCCLLTSIFVQQQRLSEALSLAERAESLFNTVDSAQYAQHMHQQVTKIRGMMSGFQRPQE